MSVPALRFTEKKEKKKKKKKRECGDSGIYINCYVFINGSFIRLHIVLEYDQLLRAAHSEYRTNIALLFTRHFYNYCYEESHIPSYNVSLSLSDMHVVRHCARFRTRGTRTKKSLRT